MIKEQEVAILKTTGEAVFVLSTQGELASVRRPVYGQTGNYHKVETFTLAELETREDVQLRMEAEKAEMIRKYAPKTSDVPSPADSGFFSN